MTPAGWDLVGDATIDDPRLAPFRDLTDVDLRRRLEPEGGYFMAEGMLVIERAVRRGLEVEAVLTSRKWLDRLAEPLAKWRGPVFVADDDQLLQLTGYRVHRGALAQVRRPQPRAIEDLLHVDGHVLVLEDLVDHTNVGLAFRSAAALGMRGVVLSPGCADPLYRRSIKTSMGAVLDLPWATAQDWSGCLAALTQQRSLIALTLAPDAIPLEVAIRDRSRPHVALMAGSEGPGLSRTAIAAAERSARIPMDGGIDSLNVAAAVAVACYAVRMTTVSSDAWP